MKNNWGKRLFVAGAVMLVLMSAVHAVSLFQKPMIRNESEKQLMDLMTNYRFTVMGSVRTIERFFAGIQYLVRFSDAWICGIGFCGLPRASAIVEESVAVQCSLAGRDDGNLL